MHVSPIVREEIASVEEKGQGGKETTTNEQGDSRLSLQTSQILPFTSRNTNYSSHHSAPKQNFFVRLFKPSPNGTSTSPPPDGGVRAWVIVLMSHLAGFNTFGFLNAYGVLQAHYVSTLNLPPSTISWIGSLQAFLLLFISFLSGRLTDAGYFRQLLFAGTVLNLIGFLGLSFSTSYYHVLLSQSVCIGLGGGMVFCPSMSIVGTYFAKKRSLALAVVAIGNSVGGLVFAAILQNCVPRLGFGWAMRICGLVAMVGLVPMNFLMKERGIKRTPGRLVEWRAFLEPSYAFFASGMFFTFLGMWVPVFYLGSYGKNIVGIDAKSSASLILIINGVGIAGRVLPAFLAARFGPLNLMIPLTFISAIILFCWPFVTTPNSVLIFDVFYGFIMAAAQGMFPPSLGSLTTDLSKMGVRMGMVFTVTAFALLIGQPLAGALITADSGNYLYAQMYAGSSMMLGVILQAAARVCKAGWGWRIIV